MLKISLPVGLVGKDGYTNSQIRARAAVAEKTGIPIIPQITLYGEGYNREVVEKGVKDLKSILGYDADSKGLLVHEDYRTNVFFQEGLERARKDMSYFQGQNVAMFLIHFPKLLDYGLEGLLHQRTLSRLEKDIRKYTGRAVFDKSPFNMKEYDIFVNKSAGAVLRAKEYSRQNGFENALAVETVNAHDFIVVPSEQDLNTYFGGREGFAKFLGEESQIKFMDRDHVQLERAIAGGIDLGGLTCSLEEINKFSRKTGVKVCIDSEHLNIDHMISEKYNLELLKKAGCSFNEEERGILESRGFFLARGLPRIYDKPLNSENIVGNVENTCKIGHMTGGFEPEIRVNGILVPGSHIGIDPESNLFVGDNKAREEWWSKTEKRIQKFAKLMEGNGVEIAVLEPKLGAYTNKRFEVSYEEPYYSQEMAKTVRNFARLTREG